MPRTGTNKLIEIIQLWPLRLSPDPPLQAGRNDGSKGRGKSPRGTCRGREATLVERVLEMRKNTHLDFR